MARPDSKQGMIFAVMNANADRPMEEVVELILQLKGVPGKPLNEPDVRSTYLWAIRTGKALGVGKTKKLDVKPIVKPIESPRAKSVTRMAKETIAKAKVPTLIKAKPDMSFVEPLKPIKNKTVEEIADIRAKNMARLKAVGQKFVKGQYAEGQVNGVSNFNAAEAKAYVEAVTADIDNFVPPSAVAV